MERPYFRVASPWHPSGICVLSQLLSHFIKLSQLLATFLKLSQLFAHCGRAFAGVRNHVRAGFLGRAFAGRHGYSLHSYHFMGVLSF
jgi:hypothetical protein